MLDYGDFVVVGCNFSKRGLRKEYTQEAMCNEHSVHMFCSCKKKIPFPPSQTMTREIKTSFKTKKSGTRFRGILVFHEN